MLTSVEWNVRVDNFGVMFSCFVLPFSPQNLFPFPPHGSIRNLYFELPLYLKPRWLLPPHFHSTVPPHPLIETSDQAFWFLKNLQYQPYLSESCTPPWLYTGRQVHSCHLFEFTAFPTFSSFLWSVSGSTCLVLASCHKLCHAFICDSCFSRMWST